MVGLHTILICINKIVISKIVISHTSSLILRRGGSGGLRIIDPPSEKGYRTRNLAVCDWRSCNFFPVLFKDFWIKKTSPPRNFDSIYKKRNPKSVENEISWVFPKLVPDIFWDFLKNWDFWKFSKISSEIMIFRFSKTFRKIMISKIFEIFKNLKIFENSQKFSRTNFGKT